MNERKDLAAAMVTIDRSPSPNYLETTLENLKRCGMFTSHRFHSLTICDSGSGGISWVFNRAHSIFEDVEEDKSCIVVMERDPKVCANMNVAGALKVAAKSNRPWVVFLEDDIDVCDNFFDGVGLWLDRHASEQYRIYPLGSVYSSNGSAVVVPVGHFYGTQAFAIRTSDASLLAEYLIEHCFDKTHNGTGYDLSMSDWLKECYPAHGGFLAVSPSMVQHIGSESIINPRPNVHTFASWPGREWSYV